VEIGCSKYVCVNVIEGERTDENSPQKEEEGREGEEEGGGGRRTCRR
jgi:hypothetical protein